MALVLLAVAFTVYVLWSPMAGAALVAVAVFVALKPLFRKPPAGTDGNGEG